MLACRRFHFGLEPGKKGSGQFLFHPGNNEFRQAIGQIGNVQITGRIEHRIDGRTQIVQLITAIKTGKFSFKKWIGILLLLIDDAIILEDHLDRAFVSSDGHGIQGQSIIKWITI